MIEALRGLGYTTAAALADIVDNSVSAGAMEVRVNFDWNGLSSRISVIDDGCGMGDAELESAMRLGDRNPLDVRDPGDLGRFGMGLKTASFSQCRRLTVSSIQECGVNSCLRWDLDALAAKTPARLQHEPEQNLVQRSMSAVIDLRLQGVLKKAVFLIRYK
jgi:hypothetical protein